MKTNEYLCRKIVIKDMEVLSWRKWRVLKVKLMRLGKIGK